LSLEGGDKTEGSLGRGDEGKKKQKNNIDVQHNKNNKKLFEKYLKLFQVFLLNFGRKILRNKRWTNVQK